MSFFLQEYEENRRRLRNGDLIYRQCYYIYCLGQLLQALPFLYFLQHFFFLSLACTITTGHG